MSAGHGHIPQNQRWDRSRRGLRWPRSLMLVPPRQTPPPFHSSRGSQRAGMDTAPGRGA